MGWFGLPEKISALCAEKLGGRNDVSAAVRECIRFSREKILRAHLAGASGRAVCAANTACVDEIVKFLWRNSAAVALEKDVCIIALGGYGRRELCPYSDIDILFLYDDNVSDEAKQKVVEGIMYPLWDTGLKLGHTSATVAELLECVSHDVLLKNSLLDARRVCGQSDLFARFQKVFAPLCRATRESHFESLMRLKRDRHASYNWTAYIQEPNIKNGIGGLRDFQTMRWKALLNFGESKIGALMRRRLLMPSEYISLRRSFDFLLRVRNDLHFLTNRPTDVLDLEKQAVVAERLGFSDGGGEEAVEAFMRRVYKSFRVIDTLAKTARKRMGIVLPKDILATMRRLGSRVPRNRKYKIDGFCVYRGEIKAQRKGIFRRKKERILRLFSYCQQFGCAPDDSLEIELKDARDLIDDNYRSDPENNKCFLSVLQFRGGVFPALEVMHYWGVLGRFIPEFMDITCMVQREFFHRYTVDMHTLRCIEHLDRIFCATKDDGLYWHYHRVLTGMRNPLLAYLILFFHDIGKSDGIRGHAEVGAEIAGRVLRRLRVSDEDIDTIVQIIRNHLEMARFWQSYDIEEESEIAKFAKIAGDEETLKLLYITTFCDARGTSEDFWNSYKQGLHESLYRQTLSFIRKGAGAEDSFAKRRDRELAELAELPELENRRELLREHIRYMPPSYFSFHNRADVLMHIKMIAALGRRKNPHLPVIEWIDDPNRSITRLCVVSNDRTGLFCILAGVLSLSGFDILGSKVLTRADGITIDTFYLTGVSGGVSNNMRIREHFSRRVAAALADSRALESEIDETFYASRRAVGAILQEVFLRREAGKSVLEVRGRDKVGLLYKIARCVRDCGYDIVFARINTEAGWAHDTFYVCASAAAESSARLVERLKSMS